MKKTWQRIELISLALLFLLGIGKLAPAENLIRNASFEVGAQGWTWQSSNVPHDWAFTPVIDDSTAAFGKYSLRVELPKQFQKGAVSINSAIIKIKPKKRYTLSFSMKADKPATVQARLSNAFSFFGGPLKQTFTASSEWKRFSITGELLEEYTCVFFDITAPNSSFVLHLDGICLVEGQSPDFVSSRKAEIGFSSGQKFNTYRPGAKVEPVLLAFQCDGKSARYKLDMEVEETLADKRRTETISLEFKEGQPNRDIVCPMKLDSERQGVYKVIARLKRKDGSEVDYAEYVYAVMNPVPPPSGLMDDSLYAQDHLASGNRASIEDYLQQAQDCGVRWIRADGYGKYSGLEPAKYDRLDDLYERARKHGIGLMVCLGEEPHHIAALKKEDGSYNTEILHNWASMLGTRFKGRIKYWEMMNESCSMSNYAEVMKSVATGLKEADPECKVVGLCAMGCEFDRLNDRLVKDTLWKYMDILSFHIYVQPNAFTPPDLCLPPLDDAIGLMREELKKAGGILPIWETEGGFQCNNYYTHMRTPEYFSRFWAGYGMLDEIPGNLRQQQVNEAAYMVRKHLLYQYYDVARFFNFVYGYLYFGYMANYYSMFEYDDTPKLVYVAYAQMVKMLEGAKCLRKLEAGERFRGYIWSNQDRLITTFHNVDNQSGEIKLALPPDAIKVQDMCGNPVKVQQGGGHVTVSFSGCPVYILSQGLKADDIAAAFEKGRISGIIPFLMGVTMEQDPKTRQPAVAVVVTNTSTEAVAPELEVVGVPEDWKMSRTTVKAEVPRGGMKTFYLPVSKISPQDHPVHLRVNYIEGANARQAAGNINRLATCPRRKSEIMVDGNVQEEAWRKALHISLDKKEQVVVGQKDWQGSDQASADLYVTWDEKSFYIAAKVRCAHFIQNKTKKIFNSSCFELAFGMRPTDNVWNYLYNDSNYQFCFAPATDEHPGYEVETTRGRDPVVGQHNPYPLKGCQVASQKTENGWTIEVSIPFSNFMEMPRGTAGAIIMFDAAVDIANEKGDRQFQLLWEGRGDFCARVDGLGWLVLAD